MEHPILLVCGYGCHLTENIKGYLCAVYSYAVSRNVRAIITSGGFTNQKTAPGVSEAMMMKEFLQILGVTCPIFCEENAITTNENIIFASDLIHYLGFEEAPIVIFCDKIRSFKVRYVAKRIFKKNVVVEAYNFGRSLQTTIRQWLITTPIELLAFYLPSFSERMRSRRLSLNQIR